MKIEQIDNFKIKITDSKGGSITSQSVEAILLYEILKRLDTSNIIGSSFKY
jgi:hypothetical protein